MFDQRADLLLGLSVRFGIAVLAIADLRILHRGHQNLRQVVLRLSDIELRGIGFEEIAHVLIGDGDLGHHFAVDELLNGNLPAQRLFLVGDADAAILELLLELLFGEGAFQLGELVFHFAFAGFETQFLGALGKNFIVDQLIHDVEAEQQSFFGGWVLPLLAGHAAIIFFHFVAADFTAIDSGPHIRGRRLLLAAAGHESEREEKRCADEAPRAPRGVEVPR